MTGKISRPIVLLFLLLLTLTLYLYAVSAGSARQRKSSEQESKKKPQPISSHVIVITISGLRSDFVTGAESYSLRIPTLQSLQAKGAYAVGIESVFPSQSIPAHASILTGTLPADHGVTSDYAFDENEAFQSRHPHQSAKEIKTDTICELARRMGLSAAAVGFPLTSGATIDFNLPDEAQPETDDKDKGEAQAELTKGRNNAASKLRNEVLAALKSDADAKLFGARDKFADQAKDSFKASAAAYIIEKYRPNLLLINFTSFDVLQKRHGLLSKESLISLELIDGLVKKIIDATERSRTAEETAFLITSDSGASKVGKEFRPNVLLAKKGWLTSGEQGRIVSWQAAAQSLGGSAAVFIKNPQDERLVREIEAFFQEQAETPDSPIWRIISKRDATKLGADPRVAFYIDAAPSYAMSSISTGSVIARTADRASNGYAPSRAEMRAAFIAAGKGIKSGIKVEYARLIDIAPTVAKLLGLEMKTARGRVIAEVIN